MRRTKFTPFRENRHPKNMRLRNVFRWILYGLLILLAFIFFYLRRLRKPLLMIPIALCISSVSGAVVSGGVGIVCGFCMDVTTGSLPGYHAILLFLLCMLTALLYDRLMQRRYFNMLLFTAVVTFLVTGADFVFRYAMWGYDHMAMIYTHYMLPCLLYTCISTIVIYPVFHCIHRFPARSGAPLRKPFAPLRNPRSNPPERKSHETHCIQLCQALPCQSLVLASLCLCAWRLMKIQVVESERYSIQHVTTQKYTQTIQATRGEIVDSSREPPSLKTRWAMMSSSSRILFRRTTPRAIRFCSPLPTFCKKHQVQWSSSLPISETKPYTFTIRR